MTAPRGIRNNNPGNIREPVGDKTAWVGERATNDDAEFEEFLTPEHGLRALAIVLRTYQQRHGLRTVRQLITRWAPPNENQTDVYVRFVAERVGVQPDEAVDLTDRKLMIPFMRAIVRKENGVDPYRVEQFHAALDMAGWPPARSAA
jgi:hypothetical protein